MTRKRDYEYQEYLKRLKGYFSIDPCCKRDECGNYVISMMGFLTHFKKVPPGKLVDIASLNIGEMMELRDQLDAVIDLEIARTELEGSFNINERK